jgi:hypothetical protein
MLVKLDWSTLRHRWRIRDNGRQRAVNALLSSTLIPELGGRSLAELPLHSWVQPWRS